jgi:hypothetical protein
MKYSKPFVILIINILAFHFGASLYAQNTSSIDNLYRQAQDYYQEGKIDSATILLDSCLRSNEFLKAYIGTRADIYRLLAFAYITLDRLQDAQQPIKKMLALRPFYQKNREDPMYFQIALDSLEASSLFSIGLRSGTNVAFARRIGEAFSMISGIDNPNLGEEQYSFGLGFYLGFHFRYRIFKNITIGVMPTFASYTYSYREDYRLKRPSTQLVGSRPDTIFANFNYAYKQTLRYLEFPLVISYTPTDKYKFSPYISAGWYQGFLLVATKESSASFVTNSQSFPNQENYIKVNNGYLLGIGFTYRMSRLVLNLEANYKYGLINLTNSTNRFANAEIALGFYDIPNDIKINNIEVGLNILYNLNFKVF